MFSLDELIHLSAQEIRSIHDDILQVAPGLAGVRPGQAVDSLVGRIHQNLTYQPFSSVVEVAALYAEVIAKGHVFNDGNKRTALTCMMSFLEINDVEVSPLNEDQLADKIVDLAEGRIRFPQLALWLSPKTKPR